MAEGGVEGVVAIQRTAMQRRPLGTQPHVQVSRHDGRRHGRPAIERPLGLLLQNSRPLLLLLLLLSLLLLSEPLNGELRLLRIHLAVSVQSVLVWRRLPHLLDLLFP